MFFDPADYLAANPERAHSGREARQLRNDARQRARLCEAATRVAAEHGFEAASAKKTFRAADLGPATFYRLFRDFEHCALEAFERCAQTALTRLGEAAERGGEDPGERLAVGLSEAFELCEREPAVARLLLVEIRVGASPCREAHQRWLDRLAALLASEDTPGGVARLSARALAGLLAAKVRHSGRGGAGVSVEELVEVALWSRRGGASEEEVAWSEPGRKGDTALPRQARPHKEERRARATREQRERILAAMSKVVGAKGYRGARVNDVAQAAGVSVPLFYAHFQSKEECLLAAFDVELAVIEEQVVAAVKSAEGCAQGAESGLRALLEALAAGAWRARLLAVEVRAAGPEGEKRYEEALLNFATLVGGGTSHEVARMIASTIAGTIAREVEGGRAGELESLLPELLFTTLAPYLGGEKAAARARAVRRGQER